MRLNKAAAVFLLSCWFSIFSGIRAEGLSTGVKAPDFRLPLAGSGGESGLSDFLNKKIVIVHFWKSR
jgi:hypothetical protein